MTETSTRGTSLAQIIAIAGGAKTRADDALNRVYKTIQKGALFVGQQRTYSPKDDDGDQLPPESQAVQMRVEDLITDVTAAVARMLDVVATLDEANTQARADLVVDGIVLMEQVPVTYLMWLEKKVIDLRTLISKLPVLDVSEVWEWDENLKAWRTTPTETVKTKKVPRNHVIAKATDRHPEQVQVYHEDVITGTWRTVKLSGAVPASMVFEMHTRAERLLDAIRFAREQANSRPVTNVRANDAILSYLFGPELPLR